VAIALSIDYGGALGVDCAVAVLASNLTLMPAVMLSCPDFLLGTLAHYIQRCLSTSNLTFAHSVITLPMVDWRMCSACSNPASCVATEI
jgi:hypothetical protein